MKFSKMSPWSPPFNLKSVVLGRRAAKASSQEQEEKQDCKVKPQQEQQSPVETKESSPRRCSYSSPRMSCDASQRHYFAQFKDALQTKEHSQEEEEESTRRRYSGSPCAGVGGSGSGTNSPAVGRNVIARLMGLEDDAPCSPSITSAAARTAKSPRGVASSGSISKSPRQGYRLVQTAADEKRRASQEPSFLDEMEDHLRQCDRALERIEAVMQLKKRLLCKQQHQQQRIRIHRPATKFATNEESRCHRLEVERGHLANASEYYHHSPRSMSPRTPKVEQQCSARFREVEEEAEEEDCDYYYYSPSLRRPRPEKERQQPGHNKSVSYGAEMPIFSPSSYGYEEAARALRVSLAHPPAMYLNNRPAMHTARNTAGRPTVEEACGLTRSLSTRSRTEHKPAGVDVCNEQPSPVSVLESNAQDETSPASSDDYYYHQDSRPCARAAETRRTAEPRRTRSKVVRALWAASAPPASAPPEKCNKEKEAVAAAAEDLDLLTWSSDNESEVAEIALLLECLIFKRLVEETIWDMKQMHPKFGRKRTSSATTKRES